jgi:hypothetical protein
MVRDDATAPEYALEHPQAKARIAGHRTGVMEAVSYTTPSSRSTKPATEPV